MNEKSKLHFLGMSPGNSYFKYEEISYLLKKTITQFNKVVIMIADIPAISTYVALGYPANRARRDKVVPKSNALKNKVKKAMKDLGYTHDQVKILNWQEEVEDNPKFRKCYQSLIELTRLNPNFRVELFTTTRDVLENTSRDLEDLEEATETAVHYLISEIAFLEFSIQYYGIDQAIYIYHKNWPIYENYIAGKFDLKKKPHLDFLLMENPYETYNVMWGSEIEPANYADTLSRIQATKTLRIGVTNYEPAFMYDQKLENFSGIFYYLISKIADKYEWKIIWTEETGYGVVTDAINHERIDLFAAPVWPTKAREKAVYFSDSIFESEVYIYSRFGSGFKERDLKKDPLLRVAIKENDVTDNLSALHFPQSRKVYIPQLKPISELLNFVAKDKADFTFVAAETARAYNQKNSIPISRVSRNPVCCYPNCFIVKNDQKEFLNFLNEEIKFYKQNGFIEKLIQKYIHEPLDPCVQK